MRSAPSVQEKGKGAHPVNLVFLEPSLLLEEDPCLEDETIGLQHTLQSLMNDFNKIYKEDMHLSDVIPVTLCGLSAQ